jgi:WD40 repeat protein
LADLFSLGSLLYAMATGGAPFHAADSMGVLRRVSDDPARPVREVNPDVPDWLAAIIDKLHAKDPAKRFQSAAAVAELLANHLAHLQQPALAPLPDRASPAPPPRGRRRRSPRAWLAAAAALVFVLGGLAVTEATGVTNVRAAVIRIFTPDGTLVVEVDDRDVKVTIEGDGGLVITGAGPQEVRLKPGAYRVHATKDGKPARVDRELVTISRGGKQLVKVTLEPAAGAAAAGQDGAGLVRTLTGHTGPVWSVAFTPSREHVLSASDDSSVRVWDAASGKELQRFEGHRGVVRAVEVDPKGLWAISVSGNRAHTEAGDWKVCMWEIASAKELHQLSGHGPAMTCVAVSRDGRQALFGNYDGTVWLYDVSNWRELRRFKTHLGLSSVAFTSDGKDVLTAAFEGEHQSQMSLWSLDTGRAKKTFEGHSDGIGRAIFTPDDKQVLSAGFDCTVRVWDAAKAVELGRMRGHTGNVPALAISADGRWAVSGAYDKTVRLWDLQKRSERRVFEGHSSGVQSVAISGDGRFAVSGSFDGTVRLWRLPP